MSRRLGVQHGLELATGLTGAIEEFAEREAALEQEYRSARVAAKRAFGQGVSQEEEALEKAVTELTAQRKAGEERVRARHEARVETIEQALAAARRQLLRRAEEAKGQTVSELHLKELQAKEQRKKDGTRLEETYGGLQAALAEEQARLADVSRRARGAMRGHLPLQQLLKPENGAKLEVGEPDRSGGTTQFLERAQQTVTEADDRLSEFRAHGLPRLTSLLPWWVLLVLGAVVAAGASRFWEPEVANPGLGGVIFGGVAILTGILQFAAGGGSKDAAKAVAEAIERARRAQRACEERIAGRYQEELKELEEAELEGGNRWEAGDEAAKRTREEGTRKLDDQHQRVLARNDAMLENLLAPIVSASERKLAERRAQSDERVAALQATFDAELARLEEDHDTGRSALEEEWRGRVDPIYGEASRMTEALAPYSTPWAATYLENWTPPGSLADVARFGRLEVPADALAEDKGLTLPGASGVEIPLSLELPREGSVLFETEGDGRAEAIGALNNIILRLLATTPPGKLNFTIVDPVGLGENFAGVMHLADYEDSVINGRIWTQRGQIEEKLAELNEHIEKVIQMYLRNEYETITEYNEQAGNIAEKYHFLVIADFPAGFSETAAKRLQSIATTGARCGIFTLIHWDHREAGPQDFVPESLRDNSIVIRHTDGHFALGTNSMNGVQLRFDPAPDSDLAIEFVQKIGRSSIDSNRVEVPFEHVIPPDDRFWESSTTNELRVPIGRTGATKLQYLAIGKGTRQHALFAGKTGSGKSTLFHVIITNLALWCSPEEVEFYLVDFKKGVEFKCYAAKKLPHARVVAIESDREFGLSVLQRVDDELKRRGDLFRKLGVQDIPGYKKAGGTEPMPRSLLMIDEFQELFVEDDRIAQSASVLLDRIVRQGRAFGIHVLLGSQTLGGAYSMARTTMGQMVIRVALQCNEADAYLIMDDTNPAPRLLTRPGEGIYNDSAGAIQGNSPFQVVWLSDDERDEYLDRVGEVARERNYTGPAPIVFEGNAPADVEENEILHGLLHADSIAPTASPRAWLGAPNSIKGPTEAVFHRQSGNNLLMIGQREEAALAMMGVALVSLAAQLPREGARFLVCDGTAPGSAESEFLQGVVGAIPHEVTLVKAHDVPAVVNEMAEEMKRRGADEEAAAKAPPWFLFVQNLQKFKKLKHEDDFDFSFDSDDSGPSAGAQLNELVTEGTGFGLHVLASVDSNNNLNRFLSRKAVSEFEMRVVFQMSANDSAALVDSPAASTLGLHRALFYNEHEGYLETFRPYALPGSEWIERAGGELRRLVG